MSDEEHHFESQADAGASKTFPQQAGTIRKNGYIVIKGRPCKVVDSTLLALILDVFLVGVVRRFFFRRSGRVFDGLLIWGFFLDMIILEFFMIMVESLLIR